MPSNDNSDQVKDNSRRAFFRKSAAAAGAPVRELASPKPKEKIILGKHTKQSAMSRRTFVKVSAAGAAVVGLAFAATKALPGVQGDSNKNPKLNYKGKVTNADRLAAAKARPKASVIAPTVVPAPGGTPDYFGTTPNYALSPLPTSSITVPGSTTGFTSFLSYKRR